ncbi:hypothetical protein T484DRAFT_1800004 [Baffinella frigidus]|nr:hypothetical protein T484DRAFT_1800004 [Cryptophyta sp. CCMP2293]
MTETLAESGTDLSLALPAGAGNSLLVSGPSGCGKSTLVSALGGLWPHFSGTTHVPKREALFTLNP